MLNSDSNINTHSKIHQHFKKWTLPLHVFDYDWVCNGHVGVLYIFLELYVNLYARVIKFYIIHEYIYIFDNLFI